MTLNGEFPSLMTYFGEIEDFFCARRNAPLLLSPLDFEKVAEWHEAKIPLEVVKGGIALYFDKLDKRRTPLRKAICISFAEGSILGALEEYRQSRIGARCGLEDGQFNDKARKERFLDDLGDRLSLKLSDQGFTAAHKDSSALISAIINILEELKLSAKVSIVDIENKLSPLDSELGRLLLFETPQELKDRWTEEAMERLVKAKIGCSGAIVEAAGKKVLLNRVFHSLGIPRLSILYYDE
jgi:hypothetical protein